MGAEQALVSVATGSARADAIERESKLGPI
jgi:hypothetical protein